MLNKRYLILIITCIALLLAVGCRRPQLEGYKGALYFHESLMGHNDLNKIITDSIKKDKEPDNVFELSSNHNTYYSRDIDNVHVIMLNSNEILRENSNNSNQLVWLRKDLALHKKSKFKIVAMEHPYFTSCISKRKEARKVYQVLEPILRAYNVDLIINGSVGAYERYEKNNIIDITTGFSMNTLKIPEDFKNRNYSKSLHLNNLQYIRVSTYKNGLKVDAVSCGKYIGGKLIPNYEIIDSYTVMK